MSGETKPARLEHNAAVYADWNTAVPAWTRWDDQWSRFSAPLNELLAEEAHVRRGLHVLDVAGGSGEPALSIARAVGAAGRVTVTDFVPGMLAAARRRAQEGALTNMGFVEADAEALPFANGAFDAVTCRFGLYYFSDPPRALREMRRVLRPAGRAALVTWGPFELNPYWSAGSAVVAAAMGDQAPAPPEEFRFSGPRRLALMMEAAGLQTVRSELRLLMLLWPGPAEELASRDMEEDPRVARLVASDRERLRASLEAAYRPFSRGGHVALPSAVVLTSGAR
jgi:SAM-dependent methyltransferase